MTHVSVRASLLAVTTLLSIGVISMTARESLQSWTAWTESRRIVQDNQVSDLLLTAAEG